MKRTFTIKTHASFGVLGDIDCTVVAIYYPATHDTRIDPGAEDECEIQTVSLTYGGKELVIGGGALDLDESAGIQLSDRVLDECRGLYENEQCQDARAESEPHDEPA